MEQGDTGRRPGTPAAEPVALRKSSSPLGVAAGGHAEDEFGNALRELKDLRSQLHQAADCCEKAFLDTEKKKLILENTKSYICDAVVAVIDHLGNVSSKLEHRLHENTEITETEQKISLFKQRLLTCQQYAIAFELSHVRGDTNAVRYHRRYLSQSTHIFEGNNGANSSKDDPKSLEVISPTVSAATVTFKPYAIQFSFGKEHLESNAAERISFSFNAEDSHIIAGDHKKKANHGNNFLAFLKKNKRRA